MATARPPNASCSSDDGVASRGHRANLMNPKFKLLGLAEGPHPQFASLQVQTFAQSYTEGGGAVGAPAAPPAAAPKPTVAKLAASGPATLTPRVHLEPERIREKYDVVIPPSPRQPNAPYQEYLESFRRYDEAVKAMQAALATKA